MTTSTTVDNRDHTAFHDYQEATIKALRERVKELEFHLEGLIERIDLNGGMGPYVGGRPFVLKYARESLEKRVSKHIQLKEPEES